MTTRSNDSKGQPVERRKADRRAETRRLRDLARYAQELAEQVDHLKAIGLALSAEKQVERIFEMVVTEARRISHADAGTVYRVSDDGRFLEFTVMQNQTMNVFQGGFRGDTIDLPPVPLYVDGEPNHANVSSHVALAGTMVNIADVYEAEGFDFNGTRAYDKTTGYRSRSMLVLPMRNHEDEIIGVIQLLNSLDPDTGRPRSFPGEVVGLVEALASQAAVALTNNQLIRDLKGLLYSFIKSIASAIDAKSPYTKGHIDRVVKLTMLLAEGINLQMDGPFADNLFSEQEWEELKLAAWMHDVGKIAVPEHVVDKQTRLQTVFDRAELVRTRFDLIEQGLYARWLEQRIELLEQGAPPAAVRAAEQECEARRSELAQERDFVLACNNPSQVMDEGKREQLEAVAAKTFTHRGKELPYLTEDEVLNLCIRAGTLTEAERSVIQNHAVVTRDMLSALPFPKGLENVPVVASRHHEKLDGSGYPDGLSGDDLSLQARILAVADIFEALTARDRPYKQPMKVSKALEILEYMKKDGHLDPDVLDIFVSRKIYRAYAEAELDPDQVDVD